MSSKSWEVQLAFLKASFEKEQYEFKDVGFEEGTDCDTEMSRFRGQCEAVWDAIYEVSQLHYDDAWRHTWDNPDQDAGKRICTAGDYLLVVTCWKGAFSRVMNDAAFEETLDSEEQQHAFFMLAIYKAEYTHWKQSCWKEYELVNKRSI